MEFQHPQFFVSQSEKLNTLLNVVVTEAKITTDPEACIDYLELTEILTALLDEVRLYCILDAQQLREKEREVHTFVDKIETIQDAVADWDTRTRTNAMTKTTNSRKRARSVELEEETMRALKRRRETESEQDLVADAIFHGSFNHVLPSIEVSPEPPREWWNEPFYD